MFGIRVLVIFIGVALVIAILKHLAVGSRRASADRRERVDKMVQCHRCGVYLPEQNAIQGNSHYYCSRQHLREDQGQG
jgi:uncharacterized protein